MAETTRLRLSDNIEEDLAFAHLTKREWFAKHVKLIVAIVGILFLLLAIIVIPVALVVHNNNKPGTPKSIIFMIGDGFGPPEVTLARVAGGHSLVLDSIVTGRVQTYSSNSWVTDSAAGATAYACGLKTYNGAIGVDPDKKPCGTLLEAAKARGMMTGIVVTDAVAGATPASFSSHAVNRSMEHFISKQQIDNGLDIIFGGGSMFYSYQGIDLIDYAKQKGYTVITSLEEFNANTKTPVIALFAPERMSFEIDRDSTAQPSLARMTEKALSLVNGAPNGFFLMVEGSNIDVAGHQNDPVANYHDTLAYDEAVKIVVEYTNKYENSMMVAVSDHETGGLALGINGVYSWDPEILRNVKASASVMSSKIRAGTSIADTLLQYANLNITSAELEIIQAGANKSNNDLIVAIGNVISKRAGLGWSTTGHTGVDVYLYANGWNTASLKGTFNNIDVGGWVAQQFSFDLAAQTNKLANFSPVGDN